MCSPASVQTSARSGVPTVTDDQAWEEQKDRVLQAQHEQSDTDPDRPYFDRLFQE